MSAIQLEVGKLYVTRDGTETFKVEALLSSGEYACARLKTGRLYTYGADGSFEPGYPDRWDLVKEASRG